MARSETLSTDQFSGSGGDPDFTFFSTQFGEAFRALILPPVEGERKVSWNLGSVFGVVSAYLAPHMLLNTENIVILPSSNLGAAFDLANSANLP
jgi:hypothetical protein